MSAITFPQNPLDGQIQTINGIVWIWDGSSWSKLFKGWSFALDSSDNTQYNLYYTEGNVGINNTSPNTKLNIQSNTLVGNETLLRLQRPDGHGTTGFNQYYNSAAGDDPVLWGLNFGLSVSDDTDGKVGIKFESGTGPMNHASDKIFFKTSGSDKMVIDTSGNVGIGTPNPDNLLSLIKASTTIYDPLDIKYGTDDGTLLRIENNETTVGPSYAGMLLQSSGASVNVSQTIIGSVNTPHPDTGGWSGTHGKFFIGVRGSNFGNVIERFCIDSEGRVGIGTTAPEGKLHIDWDTGFWDATLSKYNPTLLLEAPDPTITFRDNTNDEAQYHIRWQRANSSTDGTGLRFFRTDYNIPDLTIDLYGNVVTPNDFVWMVSDTNLTWQKADARADGDEARLHWHGSTILETGIYSSTNFKHAWYDGDHYINVDVESDAVKFTHSDTNQTAELRVEGNLVYHEGNLDPVSIAGKWSDGTTSGDIHYSSGNVGIGTSAPNQKLDIITGETQSSCFHIGERVNEGAYFSSTTDNALQIWAGAQLDSNAIRARATAASGITLNNGLVVFYTDDTLTDGATYTQSERMRITADGNVGIGTSEPSGVYKLSVENTSGGSIGILSKTSDANSAALKVENSAGSTNLFEYQNKFTVRKNSTDAMVIDSSGNVGIGTTSPEEKLHVNGYARLGDWISKKSFYHDKNYGEDNYIILIEYDTNSFASGKVEGFRNGDAHMGRQVIFDFSCNSTAWPETPTDTEGSIFVRMGAMLSGIDMEGFYSLEYDGKKYLTIKVPRTSHYHALSWDFQGRHSGTDDNFFKLVGYSELSEAEKGSITLVKDYVQLDNHLYRKGGNVGIGTETPSRPLHVMDLTNDGSGGVKVSSYLPVIELQDMSSGGGSSKIQQDQSVMKIGPTTSNTHLVFNTEDTERIRIDADGKVGIGTTPLYELHVKKDQNSSTNFAIQNHNVHADAVAQIFVETKPGGGDPQIHFQIDGVESYTVGIDNSDSDKFKISDYGSLGTNDRLVIDSSGNVDIGNSSSNVELKVNNNTVYHTGNIGGAIGAGEDLNTYRTTGFFTQILNNNTTSTGAANYPVNTAGILQVINDDFGNGLHTSQTYYQYNSSNVWSRYYYNGSWSGWVNLNTDLSGTGQWTVSGSDIYYNTGNVGIGTSAPKSELHIKAKSNRTPTSLAPNELDNNSVFRVGMDTGDSSIYFAYGNAGDAIMQIANSSGGTAQDLFINPFGGKVGIGETNPDAPLHVDSSTGNLVAKFSSSDEDAYISFEDDGTTTPPLVGANDNDLLLWTNNQKRVTVKSDGNVGIGTSAPGAKLHATGDIVAQNATNPTVSANDNGTLGASDKSVYMRYDTVNDVGVLGSFHNGTGAKNLILNQLGGNVGIGTSAPIAKLHVYGATSGGTDITAITAGNNGGVSAAFIAYQNSHAEIRIGTAHDLLFKTNDNNERCRVTNSGDFKIKNGNLVIQTAGKGIDSSLWTYNGTSKWSNTSGTSRSLRFGQYSDDSAGYFGPESNLVNTNSDGKIDLGTSDGRFRDAHFSGTVNAGVLTEGGIRVSNRYALNSTLNDYVSKTSNQAWHATNPITINTLSNGKKSIKFNYADGTSSSSILTIGDFNGIITGVTAGTGLSGGGTSGSLTLTNADRGSSQNIFKNIAVSGQSTISADQNNGTLTFAAGTGITLTTDATNDTLTISSSGSSQSTTSIDTEYNTIAYPKKVNPTPITLFSDPSITNTAFASVNTSVYWGKSGGTSVTYVVPEFKDFKKNHNDKYKLGIYSGNGYTEVIIEDLISVNPTSSAHYRVYWDDEYGTDSVISLYFSGDDLYLALGTGGGSGSNNSFYIHRIDMFTYEDYKWELSNSSVWPNGPYDYPTPTGTFTSSIAIYREKYAILGHINSSDTNLDEYIFVYDTSNGSVTKIVTTGLTRPIVLQNLDGSPLSLSENDLYLVSQHAYESDQGQFSIMKVDTSDEDPSNWTVTGYGGYKRACRSLGVVIDGDIYFTGYYSAHAGTASSSRRDILKLSGSTVSLFDASTLLENVSWKTVNVSNDCWIQQIYSLKNINSNYIALHLVNNDEKRGVVIFDTSTNTFVGNVIQTNTLHSSYGTGTVPAVVDEDGTVYCIPHMDSTTSTEAKVTVFNISVGTSSKVHYDLGDASIWDSAHGDYQIHHATYKVDNKIFGLYQYIAGDNRGIPYYDIVKQSGKVLRQPIIGGHPQNDSGAGDKHYYKNSMSRFKDGRMACIVGYYDPSSGASSANVDTLRTTKKYISIFNPVETEAE